MVVRRTYLIAVDGECSVEKINLRLKLKVKEQFSFGEMGLRNFMKENILEKFLEAWGA